MVSAGRVLLISGSLRAASTNSAVLRAAREVAPSEFAAELYEGLGDLPHFNPDDDTEPLPPAVDELRGAVREADAVLFCTPEYAGAMPGSFKNLLDWLIGDADARSIYRKPVAWINASPRGAVLAHDSLRAVLGYAHADIVEAACVHVPVTSADLDADGSLTPDPARTRIAEALATLLAAPSRS